MPNNAAAYVLDSFAVLAFFEGEPGMARVRTLLAEATKGALALHLSVINLGEILYIVEREHGLVAAQRTLAALDQLPVQIQPADRTVVLSAARLKARYSVSCNRSRGTGQEVLGRREGVGWPVKWAWTVW